MTLNHIKVPDLGFHFTADQLSRIERAGEEAEQFMSGYGKGTKATMIRDYCHYANTFPAEADTTVQPDNTQDRQ